MVDSRCGAAMTLAMPCIMGILSIYIFGAPNLLTVKTLLPDLEIDEISNPLLAKNNMFGNLTLQLETLAFAGALGDQKCNNIENIASIDSGISQLNCTATSVTDSKPQEDLVLCSTNVVCIVDNKITGTQNLVMKFPTAFQKIHWSVQTGKIWYNTQKKINDTFVSRAKQIFSGTIENPTEFNFGLIRAKLSDNTTRKTINSIESADKTDFGLQLAWRDAKIQQSETGPPTPYHYINFKFTVSENVFYVELGDEKDLISLIASVLSFFIFIMAGMHLAKAIGAKIIDSCVTSCAKRNKTKVPDDVLERKKILEEEGLRRQSVAVAFEMTELGLESRTGSTDKETIVLLQKENQLQSRAITQLQAQGAALLAQVTQQNLAIKQLLAAPTLNLNQEEEKKEKVNVTKSRTKGHKSNPTQLPEGWEKTYDANSGVDYYSNATTQESSWNAPPGSTGGSAGLVMRNNPLQTERN